MPCQIMHLPSSQIKPKLRKKKEKQCAEGDNHQVAISLRETIETSFGGIIIDLQGH